MPAVRRISRDAIVDAAVEVLREGGFSAVNARSVAKKLGCSTQPIYSSFQNMDELKAALRARAIGLHTQRVQDSLRAHEGLRQIRGGGKAAVPLAVSGGRADGAVPERHSAAGGPARDGG